jgi:hypothetical protein
MRPKNLAVLFATVSALAGCTPTLNAVTHPPPSKAADMHHPLFEDDHLQLSKGAAIGLDCREFWWGGACENAVMTSDDPTVARVLPAYLKRAPDPWMAGHVDPQRERGFVVLATGPGHTVVRVRSEEGEAEVEVTVE